MLSYTTSSPSLDILERGSASSPNLDLRQGDSTSSPSPDLRQGDSTSSPSPDLRQEDSASSPNKNEKHRVISSNTPGRFSIISLKPRNIVSFRLVHEGESVLFLTHTGNTGTFRLMHNLTIYTPFLRPYLIILSIS